MNDDGGLLWNSRRPVELPTEQPPERPRGLITAIAVGTLAVGVALGVAYQQVWEGASTEVTRLLPASSQAFARAPDPLGQLDASTAMPRWHNPGRLSSQADTLGVLAAQSTGRAAGVPIKLIRRALEGASKVEVALVPTTRGVSALVFIETATVLERRRLMAQAGPILETVDRQLGYDISRVTGGFGPVPWRESPLPIHVSVIEPYVVACVGPVDALSDLIQAKVSGLSQPLRAREGFGRAEQGAPEDGLWLYADPGNLFDALGGEDLEDGATRRALLVDTVRGISVGARLDAQTGEDRLELRAELAASDTLPRFDSVFPAGRHELLALAPVDAPFVVGLSLTEPIKTLGALRDMLAATEEQLDRPLDLIPGLFDSSQTRELLELALRLGGELFYAYEGETMIFGMPDDPGAGRGQWAIVSRVREPDFVAEALSRLLPYVLGDGMAYGIVADGDRPLHLVRSADPKRPAREVLAWRVRDDLLEMAPSSRVLEQLARIQRREETLGAAAGGRRLASIRAAAPEQSLGVVVLEPSLLAGLLGETGAYVAGRLRPDFTWVVGVDVERRALRLSSNVGLWTIAGALAAADRPTLNRLILDDLPRDCLVALDQLCEAWPRTALCHPLTPGREAVIKDGCRRGLLATSRR